MLGLRLDFHHLGLAVKDDAVALRWLEALGYRCGEKVFDPLQNVHLRLCTSPSHPTVEIVQPPMEGGSPVDGIVSRFNEMIYHTCYEVDDAARVVAEVKGRGLPLVTIMKPTPALLFGGRHVSFYRVKGFGIVELLEPS